MSNNIKDGKTLTHLSESGEASMVDVSGKPPTLRRALAKGRITMKPETLELILSGNAKKGNVLAAARLAGIMAAKKTSDLIPLCHPLSLTKVAVDFTPFTSSEAGFEIEAVAIAQGQTGVEMEALTAVAVAGLTIYDIAKAVDKGMVINDIGLWEKSGGQSGTYSRK